MAMYVSLLQFTEQGVRNAKDTIKRAAAATAEAEQMGLKVTDAFWTMGAYDVVLLLDSPDDETMTAFALRRSVHWATSRPRRCAPSAGKRWKAFWRRSNSLVEAAVSAANVCSRGR
jgi:uncharacterized protein with GYD domain